MALIIYIVLVLAFQRPKYHVIEGSFLCKMCIRIPAFYIYSNSKVKQNR